ncbi:hypothetical protein D3C81_2008450 [compost metagenome]
MQLLYTLSKAGAARPALAEGSQRLENIVPVAFGILKRIYKGRYTALTVIVLNNDLSGGGGQGVDGCLGSHDNTDPQNKEGDRCENMLHTGAAGINDKPAGGNQYQA